MVRESGEGAYHGASIGDLADIKEGKDGSVEQGQDHSDERVTDDAGIFTQRGIPAPVATVFDLPVRLYEGEEPGRGGLLCGQAGEATDRLVGGLAVTHDPTFQEEDLRHIAPLVAQCQIQLA